jgi:hypothetical protein
MTLYSLVKRGIYEHVVRALGGLSHVTEKYMPYT